jgi:NADPH-dependent 2,4-dienoyl-CoA reductase/sulfur reductase-like enzyme/Pyruvate/2-oxoacid:ferredoxin oxidoreductase delta subunit
MSGYGGEALSSALAASGVMAFSRHVKDGAPQGIFCANGQCSQCTVIVDGLARKACVTALAAGMDVRSLSGLPSLPETVVTFGDDVTEGDDAIGAKGAAATGGAVFGGAMVRRLSADVLVVGGGPSGLAATAELARLGLSVILADDKASLGGKLVLQTHKFFGSEADCYAGTRGVDIACKLEAEVRALPNVRVLANSPVVGIYKDRVAGIYVDYRNYTLVEFRGLIVAAGARERSVLFPGNGLPGVYGAGAFQTLVNRDLVRPSARVLIVGSGNVGLIAAYHALQAGIEVAGIVDILDRVGGYEVHADKIRRMGVPIYLSTGIVSVEGEGRVERATIAQVDSGFRPLLDTARTFEVDTVLVAAGLSPCDELYRQAAAFGFLAVKAGDAEEIAEASSAMFGGKISAFALAKLLGQEVSIDETWVKKREVLKSKPGDKIPRDPVVPGPSWQPVFSCSEEIPCNPCTTVCPSHSIALKARRGNLLDLPYYSGSGCKGCAACVAACPGLAVSLVRRIDEAWAEVLLPWEFLADFEAGEKLAVLDKGGAFLEEAVLLKKTYRTKEKTWVLSLKVSIANATKAAGIRVQPESATKPLPQARYDYLPDEAILCRCERVTVGEIKRYIEANDIHDLNQLKSIRVAMGACGSKTCSVLLPQLFRSLGRDPAGLAPLSLRPLAVEVPMGDLVNEGHIAGRAEEIATGNAAGSADGRGEP